MGSTQHWPWTCSLSHDEPSPAISSNKTKQQMAPPPQLHELCIIHRNSNTASKKKNYKQLKPLSKTVCNRAWLNYEVVCLEALCHSEKFPGFNFAEPYEEKNRRVGWSRLTQQRTVQGQILAPKQLFHCCSCRFYCPFTHPGVKIDQKWRVRCKLRFTSFSFYFMDWNVKLHKCTVWRISLISCSWEVLVLARRGLQIMCNHRLMWLWWHIGAMSN